MDRYDWQRSALLTDLYQLTMLQGYFERGMDEVAAFEFFVRRLPERRGFLVSAGLDTVLDYLESFAVTSGDIACLERTELFDDRFLAWLEGLRFTGSVQAMPEGTIFFADEPVLRIVAPLPQAQIIESRLINLLHFQTLIASKAARCVLAAPDRQLVDFGMRRAHGGEAALLAARSCFVAGFAGTATVPAHALYGIPVFGTMAHSFVQAHESETAAFEDFARAHRGALVLLIDTYDTERGARRVVELAPRLARDGISVHAVRLDSGDLATLAGSVRAILDAGGCESVGIFASGGLDEYALAQLADAPIDGFGVGTNLDVSADAPSLDCVYKLQEYAGVARRKRSAAKATRPGRKQVRRRYGTDGVMRGDVITLADETVDGVPLLQTVMREGRRVAPPPSLEQVRERVAAELRALPAALVSLESPADYPVAVSDGLRALTAAVDRRYE